MSLMTCRTAATAATSFIRKPSILIGGSQRTCLINRIACTSMCTQSSSSSSNIESNALSLHPGASFLLGSLAGSLGALCGVGGGMVMLPVLSYVTKMRQVSINAASLFALTSSSAIGCATYLMNGHCDLAAAAYVAGAGLIMAPIGVYCGTRISDSTLRIFMSFGLVLSLPLVYMRGDKGTDSSNDGSTEDSSSIIEASPSMNQEIPREHKVMFSGVGAVTGFASGLMGIGGGLITVSALTLISSYELSQHTIIGTALAAMVPSGCIGALSHVRAGNLRVNASLLALAGGAVLGMNITANMASHNIPEHVLRDVLMVAIGLAAMPDIMKGFSWLLNRRKFR